MNLLFLNIIAYATEDNFWQDCINVYPKFMEAILYQFLFAFTIFIACSKPDDLAPCIEAEYF